MSSENLTCEASARATSKKVAEIWNSTIQANPTVGRLSNKPVKAKEVIP
jgi:hypothetical protein